MKISLGKAIILCWAIWVPTLIIGEVLVLPLVAWFGVVVMFLGIGLMSIHLAKNSRRLFEKIQTTKKGRHVGTTGVFPA